MFRIDPLRVRRLSVTFALWLFAAVICMYLVQIPLILVCSRIMPSLAAFAVAYVVGGQVDFGLNHHFNWRPDHPTWKSFRRSWYLYTGISLVCGGINASVLLYLSNIQGQLHLPLLIVDYRALCVIAANVISGLIKFVVMDKVVFRIIPKEPELALGRN